MKPSAEQKLRVIVTGEYSGLPGTGFQPENEFLCSHSRLDLFSVRFAIMSDSLFSGAPSLIPSGVSHVHYFSIYPPFVSGYCLRWLDRPARRMSEIALLQSSMNLNGTKEKNKYLWNPKFFSTRKCREPLRLLLRP